MPNPLMDATDYSTDQPQETPVLPVQGLKRVYIYSDPAPPISGFSTADSDRLNAEHNKAPVNAKNEETFSDMVDALTGAHGVDRYQLWPERMVRSALSAPHDAMIPNPYSEGSEEYNLYENYRQQGMLPAAMDMASLAGSGGLAGTTEASLGSGPFLRPALKVEGKIYKAPVGGQHLDALPSQMVPEFQRAAMNGEDISKYDFGFMNHKGHFLSREDALKYAIDEGLVHPNSDAARSGTLTSTMDLMADSSKPGAAIEGLAKTQSPFYSALEHNVNNIAQPKMTGEQWLNTLSNKPGIKPEEMDWTGLKDYLQENKGQVINKDQVQEHLSNNKVELKDINKGGDYLKKAAEDLQSAIGNDKISVANHRDKLYADEIEQGLWSGDITPKDLPTDLQSHAEKLLQLKADQPYDPTKYHSYQLPGGENYREMLMTLPNKQLSEVEARQVLGAKSDAKLSSADIDYASRKAADEYKSSHWDEPNVLAHIRMNDRMIDGKKTLHVEEIQSDWHQAGRKQGYNLGAEFEKRKANLDADIFEKLQASGAPSNLGPMGRMSWAEKNIPGFSELVAEKARLADQSRIGGVPDAPFKKNWHELALKRVIRHAAENGYDQVSWTPGEAQAARYDLSKSISKITYNAPGTKTADKYGTVLKAYDHSGREIINKNLKPEELADNIGKEAAEKLLKTDKISDKHSLEGLDLKVGGEGMKGFYDKILVDAANKLGKNYGSKVEKQNLDYPKLSNKIGEAPIEQPVHVLPLTPQFKDTALHKGFPLFSGGFMLTPVYDNEK